MTAPLAAPAGDQSGTRAEFARSDTAGATASPEVFQEPFRQLRKACAVCGGAGYNCTRARVQLNKLATAGPICTGGQVGHLPPQPVHL